LSPASVLRSDTLGSVHQGATDAPFPLYTDHINQTNQTMTKQQTLQIARNVLIGAPDAQRSPLKKQALAEGRAAEAVAKASTMRLALWVAKGTSAI